MQTATVSCTEQIQVNIKERGAVREDFHSLSMELC